MTAMLEIRSSPRARRVSQRPSLVDITNTLPDPVILLDPQYRLPPSKALRRITGNSLRHRQSPISRLPPELLLQVAHLGTLEHFSFPIRFSHVCKLWRALALSTPALWDTILLSRSFDDLLPPSYINGVLARGRGTPVALKLDVGLYRKGCDEAGAVWRSGIILETVEPYAERWRSLELSVPSAFDLEDFFRRVLPRASALEKLVVHRSDHQRLRPSKADPMMEPIYLPKLRHFQIDGFPLPACIRRATLATVTELHILTVPAELRPCVSEVLIMLRSLRRLQRLVLYQCIQRSPPCSLIPTEAIYLPNLHTLDISHNPIYPAQHMLEHLHTPALRSLILGSHPSLGKESLFQVCSLVTRSRYRELRRLRLGYGLLDERAMVDLKERMEGVWVFGPLHVKDSSVEAANRRWEEGLAEKVCMEQKEGKKRWFS
ncbi:hypothetical protein CALVIDRAFT_563224 [Calocera viscosa TUFC12733]|uniref:Uncharacterized protein n=1 Tax=Calocera viscosa (strain TUFC12733) TaxID=1330018 RepID=A0A167MRP6_CALVF|nr:hypothetical protein CALVIDRAFT_563224 [Calocera viscosa TUFC12733]